MTTNLKSPPGHQVSAKLKQCVYYNRGNDFLGADEFRELWSSFKRFGAIKTKAYIWDSCSEPHSTAKLISLGNSTQLDELVSRDCTHIYGGVDCSRKNVARDEVLDGDFDFSCCGESAWSGVDTPPRSSLGVSDDWISRIGIDVVIEVMRLHLTLADRFNPQYGLIDYSASVNSVGGMVFDSITLMESSLNQWVEQSLWYQHRFSSYKVRGIYWGNYLSRRMIEKLNRNGDFIDRYRETAVDGNGNPNAWIWEFENGVFISLGLDPIVDCSPGEMLSFGLQANCNWLVRQFTQAELL